MQSSQPLVRFTGLPILQIMETTTELELICILHLGESTRKSRS